MLHLWTHIVTMFSYFEFCKCLFYSEYQPFKTYYISPHIFVILLQETWLSSKLMFWAKLHSEILDFSNNFKLFKFQFDRWLYKTVSGGKVIFISTLYIFTIRLQYLQHLILTVTEFHIMWVTILQYHLIFFINKMHYCFRFSRIRT